MGRGIRYAAVCACCIALLVCPAQALAGATVAAEDFIRLSARWGLSVSSPSVDVSSLPLTNGGRGVATIDDVSVGARDTLTFLPDGSYIARQYGAIFDESCIDADIAKGTVRVRGSAPMTVQEWYYPAGGTASYVERSEGALIVDLQISPAADADRFPGVGSRMIGEPDPLICMFSAQKLWNDMRVTGTVRTSDGIDLTPIDAAGKPEPSLGELYVFRYALVTLPPSVAPMTK